MSVYYIPYLGKKPKAVVINGHRLVILAKDKDTLQDHLDRLGADTVKQIKTLAEPEKDLGLIDKISRRAKAGIVFAPDEAALSDVLEELEQQLPWIH